MPTSIVRSLTGIHSRFNQRAVWWPLGVFPVRSGVRIRQLQVNSKTVSLQFPNGEYEAQQWECRHLFVDDPYGLRSIPRNDVSTVLDIGANIGFASILSRFYFPKAAIRAYEPNPRLQAALRHNLAGLNIEVFAEGVGCTSCRGTLHSDETSLQARMTSSTNGDVPITAFSDIVKDMGRIDFLKMDCEGAEWDILECGAELQHVRHMSMEYHLQYGGGKTLADLVSAVLSLGFRIEALRESSNRNVGLLRAMRA